MIKYLVSVLAVTFLASCATTPAVVYKDSEQPIPEGYKNWPKFLSEIQRPDAKQVREIYINPLGHRTAKGQPFPNGTIMVMENYAAAPGAGGKLAKGNLLRVFVMGKGDGWGASAPQGLRNGDWVYASYGADGKMTADPIAPCRACHLPLTAAKDFVHRYDEYFEKRGAY